MKTPLVLLALLLWIGAVLSALERRGFNERIAGRGDRKTPVVYDEAGLLRDDRTGDGHRESRDNGAGLKFPETRSARLASSGTDWGGLFLPVAGRQRKLGVPKPNFKCSQLFYGELDENSKDDKGPLLSVSSLGGKIKEIGDSQELSRDSRYAISTWDSPNLDLATEVIAEKQHGIDRLLGLGGATVEEATNDGDGIRGILENTKATWSNVKSNEGKLKDSELDDWLAFLSPYSTGILTETLFKSSAKPHYTRTERKHQNRESLRKANVDRTYGRSSDSLIDHQKSYDWDSISRNDDERKHKLSGDSEDDVLQWKLNLYGEYSDDSVPWVWKDYKIPNEEVRYSDEYEVKPVWFLERIEKDGSEEDEHLSENDKNSHSHNANPDHTKSYIKKNHILEENGKRYTNQQFLKKKQDFVPDPRDVLAKLYGGRRDKKRNDESLARSPHTRDRYLNLHDNNIGTNRINEEKYKQDFDRSVHMPTGKSNKKRVESIHSGSHVKPEIPNKIYHKRPRFQYFFDKLSEVKDKKGIENINLQYNRMNDQTSGLPSFEKIHRFQFKPPKRHFPESGSIGIGRSNDNGVPYDIKSHGTRTEQNSPRKDAREEIDTRENIHEKYDKYASAAETSIPAYTEENEHSHVKHRERIEEESLSEEEIDSEREKEAWERNKHNALSTRQGKHSINSHENIGNEWITSNERVKMLTIGNDRGDTERKKPKSGSRNEEKLISNGERYVSFENGEAVSAEEDKEDERTDDEWFENKEKMYGESAEHESKQYDDSSIIASQEEKWAEHLSDRSDTDIQNGSYGNRTDSSDSSYSLGTSSQRRGTTEEHGVASSEETMEVHEEDEISRAKDKENEENISRRKHNKQLREYQDANGDKRNTGILTKANEVLTEKKEFETGYDRSTISKKSKVVGRNYKETKKDRRKIHSTEVRNRKLATKIYDEMIEHLRKNQLNHKSSVVNSMDSKITRSQTRKNGPRSAETLANDQTLNVSAGAVARSVVDSAENVESPVTTGGTHRAKTGDENRAHQSTGADTSEVQSTANIRAGAAAIIRYDASTGGDNQGKTETRDVNSYESTSKAPVTSDQSYLNENKKGDKSDWTSIETLSDVEKKIKSDGDVSSLEGHDQVVEKTGEDNSLNRSQLSRELEAGEASLEKDRELRIMKQTGASRMDRGNENHDDEMVNIENNGIISTDVKTDLDESEETFMYPGLERRTEVLKSMINNLRKEFNSEDLYRARLTIKERGDKNGIGIETGNDNTIVSSGKSMSDHSSTDKLEGSVSEKMETIKMSHNTNAGRSSVVLIENNRPHLAETQAAESSDDLNSEQASYFKFTGNSDISRGHHISRAAINQRAEEELEEEKTPEHRVSQDHLSQRGSYEMISNLSLENGKRNKADEKEQNSVTPLTSNEAYSAKSSEDDYNGGTSTEHRGESSGNLRYDTEKKDHLKEHNESLRKSDKVHLLETLQNGIPSEREEGARRTFTEPSEKWGNGLNGMNSQRNDESTADENKSSMDRLSTVETLVKGPSLNIEVTESNDVTEGIGESSFEMHATKAAATVRGSKESNKSRASTYDGFDDTQSYDANLKGDESVARNFPGAEHREPPSLIRDNESEALPITSIRSTLNTKTTVDKLSSSGVDENPVISRLADGSATPPITWPDNELYKGPPMEADETSKKTPRDKLHNSGIIGHLNKLQDGKKKFLGAEEVNEVDVSSEREIEEARDSMIDLNSTYERVQKDQHALGDDYVDKGRMKHVEIMEGEFIKGALSTSHITDSSRDAGHMIDSDGARQESEKPSSVLTEASIERQEEDKTVSQLSRESDALIHEKNTLAESAGHSGAFQENYGELETGEAVANRKKYENHNRKEEGNELSESALTNIDHSDVSKEETNEEVSGAKLHHPFKDHEDNSDDSTRSKEPTGHSKTIPNVEVETQVRRPLSDAELATTLPSPLTQLDTTSERGGGRHVTENPESSSNESPPSEITTSKHANEWSNNPRKSLSVTDDEMNSNDETLWQTHHKKMILYKPRHGNKLTDSLNRLDVRHKDTNKSILEEDEEQIEENNSESGRLHENTELRNWQMTPKPEKELTKSDIDQYTTENLENLDRYPNDRIDKDRTSDNVPHFSLDISSSESNDGMSDGKSVKNRQPSFWKFAKPAAERKYKSEPFVPVPLKPFKPYPAEKGTAGYGEHSPSVSSDGVSKSEVANEDLFNDLATIFSSARAPERVKSGEAPVTGDVSTDVEATDVEEPAKSTPVEKFSNVSKESDKAKVDVYIVKQKPNRPVKVTHVESVKPFVGTSDLIPRKVYKEMHEMFKKNRLEVPPGKREVLV
ncbi:hypothetical protein WN55_11010 [Dufourea novaeangliae]|uniref:Uncharacterized protein n=1 Tax=Dufourea novaeangliae TaxID=178035 RepID=A0A154PDJ7_DUFNO|nr:hypothetical protein WN55_11010 [Dufourea novaeangliae]